MTSTHAPDDVAAFEHAAWSRCAPDYADGFAVLTAEAVGPLLDRARIVPGDRVLDLGTGTGVAAAAAHEVGAEVIGIDFSAAMLAEARAQHPDIVFRSGSADALPFAVASFDAVVANVVLHHLGDPALALREVARVLRPGGRIACTVWDQPDTLEAFGLFFAAVEKHAGVVELPHGPLFGVADRTRLESLFSANRFVDIDVENLDVAWRMDSVESLLRAFDRWSRLGDLPDAIRRAIESDVRDNATRYARGAELVIPNPMVLVSATTSS